MNTVNDMQELQSKKGSVLFSPKSIFRGLDYSPNETHVLQKDPLIVTAVAERKPLFIGGQGHWVYDSLGDREASEWWSQFGINALFQFRSKCFTGSQGAVLFWNLQEAVKERDRNRVIELLPKLEPYCQTPYEQLHSSQQWAHTAVQMPGDIGGPNKHLIQKFLTRKAHGNVLETMCGFNSYFLPNKKIADVTVVDFCAEMLERYQFPERKRILYDMERICNGEQFSFFENGSFDTIGCWGSNYLSKPEMVVNEFARLLAPRGKVLLFESTTEGYSQHVKRYFDPKVTAAWMKDAGLSVTIEKHNEFKTEWEIGDYYLVTGIKK